MQNNNKNTFQDKEDDIFIQFLGKYFPYWPLYLVLVGLFLAAGYLYGKWKIPVFEAYSSVIIKDESKGMNESEMLQQLNLFRGKKIVENEIEILKSNAFISDVVKNLGLYADIYYKGKLRNLSAYVASPVKLKFKDPYQIQKVERIPFSFNLEARQVTIGTQKYPLNQWINSKWGEISFTPNPHYVRDSIGRDFHFLIIPCRVVQSGLLANLKVLPASKLATVINLSIRDEVPERAVDILNELVRVYTEAEIDDKNMMAANTLAMVENRIRNVAGQLDSVENAIQKYRTSSGIVDISEQGRQYLTNVGQYDREIEQLKNQISILDEVEKYIISKDANTGILPPALGLNDPLLNQMLDKLNDYQLQYEKLKRTTGENSPILVSIQEQIDNMKPSILDNIRNQKVNLNISRNNYATNSGRYSAMLNTIPQKEKQLIEISRQQSIKNELYGYLLEKREEAALSFTSINKGDTRIVDKAYSSVAPVSPNKFLIYLAALVIGFGAGILFVSLKEGLNRKILFRNEIESKSNIPVISEVVKDSTGNTIIMDKVYSGGAHEQLKSLRNSLFFSGKGMPAKKVIITSTGSGEGKTFITSNLAVSLANTGKKVLLVDLDFKNKKVSELFGFGNDKGITDILKRDAAVAGMIYNSKEAAGLHIMPVGNFAENCSELLMGEKFARILEDVSQQYDFILLAGPSYKDDVNIQAVSHVADTSLFVIRQGHTSRADFSMLLLNGQIDSLKQPRFVFNGVKGRGWGVKKFGNGYGYGNNPRA